MPQRNLQLSLWCSEFYIFIKWKFEEKRVIGVLTKLLLVFLWIHNSGWEGFLLSTLSSPSFFTFSRVIHSSFHFWESIPFLVGLSAENFLLVSCRGSAYRFPKSTFDFMSEEWRDGRHRKILKGGNGWRGTHLSIFYFLLLNLQCREEKVEKAGCNQPRISSYNRLTLRKTLHASHPSLVNFFFPNFRY